MLYPSVIKKMYKCVLDKSQQFTMQNAFVMSNVILSQTHLVPCIYIYIYIYIVLDVVDLICFSQITYKRIGKPSCRQLSRLPCNSARLHCQEKTSQQLVDIISLVNAKLLITIPVCQHRGLFYFISFFKIRRKGGKCLAGTHHPDPQVLHVILSRGQEWERGSGMYWSRAAEGRWSS